MTLSAPNGTFTGPLRIDIAMQYDNLGAGPSQPLVALGTEGEGARLTLGQLGAGDDLYFEVVQGGSVYRLLAENALVSGETASFAAVIDDGGVMALYKDDTLLAEMPAEVPFALPVEDLRGPATPNDATVIDLTVEPISPAMAGGDMAIVAHPDDDLLFMNPHVAETIADGDPMTTVFVTSGDAGDDAAYWEAREMGAKAAYAQMAGADPADWVDETVTLDVEGVAWEVQSSYLADAPQVRLYFLRTPDGIDGGGTDTYGFGSLERLLDGDADQITTVDGLVTYTSDDLTQVLGAIMTRHMPDDILLQDDTSEIEHSDHVHTTELAEAALPLYGEDVTVTHFTGYISWAEEENLTPDQVALVTGVFETYAAYDPLVTDEAGALREPYTDWVLREYVTEQYSIVDGERVDGPLPEDDPEPVDPDPEDPTPVDPDPVEPASEVPAPVDPQPEPPTPVDPAPPESDLFGPNGTYFQFLAGNAGKWDVAGPTDPTPDPVDPTPVDPPPVDPMPDPAGDPFGPGGVYEQLMLSGAAKWETLDLSVDEDEDLDDSAEVV
ncbi:PIG-L family deacetylase [Antarctobacter heliothermus]|uniref:GlcNAc-PI de-N-acetylase n=1 Tax=Antarctobacter heliothermus TaxID=74033 RepID=A0A239B4Q3_9RHOB|nr:PIG-L family deacetylase [Antarctobacter heliothermus]SNS02188.1 GlcNAc-PI de-N-acetylase [Antarctobacter heliothermus]